jgi:AcrR family transcriptional regulator
MTEDSCLSSDKFREGLRRQPSQKRGKDRVEKILEAAAYLFDEVGYEAATTHQIAAKAGTAIGSLYQFFPDKASIFNAMELRHIDRVKAMYAQANQPEIILQPLRQMIHLLVSATTQLFEHPVSRVMFVQFYTQRQNFQSIDESMTQEAINFLANILKQRNPLLNDHQLGLLAEVSVHSTNALILSALRNPDLQRRQRLAREIEDLLVAYLEPYVGDVVARNQGNVMKVMICPHCYSKRVSKNGQRRGKQCYLCKDCRKQFVNPNDVLRDRNCEI